jgi:transcriptional regulator with PAS, ATPase and Fis domain
MDEPSDRTTSPPGPYMKDEWIRAIEETAVRGGEACTIVLIRGESGTGKDMLARSIHAASRQDQPFIKINCGAVPPEHLESELFGHEKGAFPGAGRRKLGKVEFAHRGTLFLDEIGLLPPALEPRLLEVLRDRESRRVGGRWPILVDVRVIGATTRTPEGLEHGAPPWSEPARLRVIDIRIPPLRERRDEIPSLASLFLSRFRQQYRQRVELTPAILALFSEYSWPGNVRELEAVVRRLVFTGDPDRVQDELQARIRLVRLQRGLESA